MTCVSREESLQSEFSLDTSIQFNFGPIRNIWIVLKIQDSKRIFICLDKTLEKKKKKKSK